MRETITRRVFNSLVAGGVCWSLAKPSKAGSTNPIRAVVFDAFAIFDPSNVLRRSETLFPAAGSILFNEWRTRQFEYSWLRTISGTYLDFWNVTEEALMWSTRKLGLNLPKPQRRSLMDEYLRMPAWDDATPALRVLKEMGFRLSFLSNLTQ